MWYLLWVLALACSITERPLVVVPPEQSKKTESGVSYQVLKRGRGPIPDPGSHATVRYRQWNISKKGSDNEHVSRRIGTFPVSHASRMWQEGLSVAKKGGRYRFWFSSDWQDTASTVVLEFELLSFETPAPFLQPPASLTPPADAIRTDSGLAYKRIKEGSGKKSPARDAHVTVHYTGWKRDGSRIDSSILRGEALSFPLQKVIAGWREGLMLMKKGEKILLWIPENLAYGTNPREGAPRGDLIFMIELLDFKHVGSAAE